MNTVVEQVAKIEQLATLIRVSAKHAQQPDPKLTEAIKLLSQVASTQMGR